MKSKFYPCRKLFTNNSIALSLALCFIFATNAYCQDLVKDSIYISKIIAASSVGKEPPYVTLVTNKSQVEAISKYIDAKSAKKAEADRQLSEKYNSTPGRRYINGDKSTIPQIVAVLNSRNDKAIAALLREMEQEYDPEGKTILYLDPEIKDNLFKLMESSLEPVVVQFAGYNRVDGYIPVFENRLLSGKSADEDRIFFWLGYTGNEKAVDYGISQNSIWLIQNLDAYMENGSEAVRQKLLSYAYRYLEKNPIRAADIPVAGNNKRDDYLPSPSGANPIKFSLLDFVIEYGDKRSLSLYNNMVAVVQKANPDADIQLSKFKLAVIKFYAYPQKKEAVTKALAQDDLFFNIVPIIYKDKELTADAAVNQLAFTNFEKFKKYRYDGIERFVRYLIPAVDKNTFTAYVKKNIKEAPLQHDLLAQYDIQKQTLAETNEYLLKNGLVSTPVMIPKKDNTIGENNINHSLSLAHITLDFDVEASIYPLDYDDLLQSFASISKNKIQGLNCYLQYHDEEDSTVYQLLVSYKDKCYIMAPSDQGDWYDMDAVNELLTAIIAETGCKEQFINWHNDGQYVSYIFGEHEKVNKLIKDYQLYYPEDEYEE